MNNYEFWVGTKIWNDKYGVSRYLKKGKRELVDILDNFRKADVIIFGDSVMNFADPMENNKTSVPRFLLNNGSVRGKVYNFSAGSYSSLVHSLLFTYKNDEVLDALDGKLIIYEINLRSFSDEWYIRPNCRFEHIKCWLDNKASLLDLLFSDKLYTETEMYNNLQISPEISKFSEFKGVDTIHKAYEMMGGG